MHIYKILILALLTYLVSCSTLKPSSDQVKSQVPPDQDTASKPVPENPISDIDFGAVILEPIEYYSTKSERDLIAKANIKLNQVIKTRCFYDFLMNREMVQTENRSSKEVADHVTRLFGRIPVSMYFSRWGSTVAYVEPPSLKINLNRKYFSPTTPLCEWVNTIAHESIGHALGKYSHDFKYTARRNFSVPYSLGFAVDACCK